MRAAALGLVLAACGSSPIVPIDDPDAGPPDAGPSAAPPIRKVLFALEASAAVDELQRASADTAARFETEPKFGAVFYGDTAMAREPLFEPPASFQQSVKLTAPSFAMPLRPAAALRLAGELIASDLAASGPDAARTHYRVILLTRDGDMSCQAIVGISPECAAYLHAQPPDLTACSRCELSRATRALRATLELRDAPRILVQPVWIRTMEHAGQRYSLQALAREGGTRLIEVEPSGLPAALAGLDFGPSP